MPSASCTVSSLSGAAEGRGGLVAVVGRGVKAAVSSLSDPMDSRILVLRAGYPLYKRERSPGRSDYVYKCSLNGKWLLRDDDDHFPLNLSRIGTKKGVEHLTDKGVTFEVWRSSQWHEDSELKVTVEDPGYYSGEDAYGGKWQTDVQ